MSKLEKLILIVEDKDSEVVKQILERVKSTHIVSVLSLDELNERVRDKLIRDEDDFNIPKFPDLKPLGPTSPFKIKNKRTYQAHHTNGFYPGPKKYPKK